MKRMIKEMKNKIIFVSEIDRFTPLLFSQNGIDRFFLDSNVFNQSIDDSIVYHINIQ